MDVDTNLIIRKLSDVARAAIAYVGSANYQEREDYATDEIERNTELALEGKLEEMGFIYKK